MATQPDQDDGQPRTVDVAQVLRHEWRIVRRRRATLGIDDEGARIFAAIEAGAARVAEADRARDGGAGEASGAAGARQAEDAHGPAEAEAVAAVAEPPSPPKRAAVADGEVAERALIGLALSGGGIRSASFCMGAVQAIDKAGLLRATDYLSTVSGGGFIGCSLAANWWGKPRIVSDKPAEPAALPDPGAAEQAAPEPAWYFPFGHQPGKRENALLRHLRAQADYLAPLGLARALVHVPALFVRGWLLNLLALLPLIATFAALLAIWIDLSRGWSGTLLGVGLSADVSGKPAALATAGTVAFLAGAALVGLYVVSRPLRLLLEDVVAGWLRRRDEAREAAAGPAAARKGEAVGAREADRELDRPWRARERTRTFVRRTTVGLAIAAVVGLQPWLVWQLGEWLSVATFSVGAGAAALAALVGGPLLRQFEALPGPLKRFATVAVAGVLGPVVLWIGALSIAAWLAGAVSVTLPVGVTTSVAPAILGLSGWSLALATIGFAAVLWVVNVQLLYDCNEVALHSFYRDRLSRAFLFAAHPDRPEWTIHTDNLRLSELETARAPYPIVNAALNVQGSRSNWARGRNADFFVFTPRFVGGDPTGYCLTKRLEKVNPRLRLASAMAISGAAFSAVAGRRTVGFARFLAALFNVRLGYWLPHPGRIGLRRRRQRFASPLARLFFGNRPGPYYFLCELLGKVEIARRFVYLTDGGHIENTGIYELLRRRCRLIVACDGEQDVPGALRFSSFADAIRFAQIDLAVFVDIDLDPVRPGPDGISRRSWAVGTIDYGRGAKGLIVYLKSSLTNTVPEYVWKYRVENPDFPHQSTMDQFFDEEQFEVYRALGHHVADDAMETLLPAALREELVRRQRIVPANRGAAVVVGPGGS